MVSPELLRRYPFFSNLTDAQLKSVAMISEQTDYAKGAEIFPECGPAETLYLLISGSVDLYYKSEEENQPQSRKEFAVGEINPGEAFGLSALLEPYQLNTTARAGQPCRILEINAGEMRRLIQADSRLGSQIMSQALRTALERMAGLRAQLAAAGN